MGFNSAFKGLIFKAHVLFMTVFLLARRLLRVSITNFGAKPEN